MMIARPASMMINGTEREAEASAVIMKPRILPSSPDTEIQRSFPFPKNTSDSNRLYNEAIRGP